MKWHHPDELPDGDMEVLAKYGNFPFANHVVVKYDNGFWWQHLPPMPPILQDGGWFGIDESAILGWAYIKEEDEK
jgi:hypothetical protein